MKKEWERVGWRLFASRPEADGPVNERGGTRVSTFARRLMAMERARARRTTLTDFSAYLMSTRLGRGGRGAEPPGRKRALSLSRTHGHTDSAVGKPPLAASD